MSRDTFNYTHGDTGNSPSSSLDFSANQRPDANIFDWYWYNVIEAIKGHAAEFDELDSDDDGVVDEADTLAAGGNLKGDLNAVNGETIWDESAGYILQSVLQNDSLDVTAGTGLTGGGSISLGGAATLDIDTTMMATRSWVNNNADVPNADYADSAGDADTLDGNHASHFTTLTEVNNNADVPNADHADTAGDADTLDGNDSSYFTTLTEVNNNADVPNADYADNAGDADTVDGNDASQLSPSTDFGDGSDGSVTYSSNSTVSGVINATDFTVNSGVTVSVSGFLLIRATNSVTINGTIDASVVGGVGGAGGAGGTAAGENGHDGSDSPYSLLTSSATGGDGGDGSGGYVGGNAGIASNGLLNPSYNPQLLTSTTVESTTYSDVMGSGGGGGAGGGTDNTDGSGGDGGDGGNGGGVVVIISPSCSGSGTIDVSGENGQDGGDAGGEDYVNAGGGGGGGGGSGGLIGIVSDSNPYTTDISGGSGGLGGAGWQSGVNGADGSSGTSGIERFTNPE
jgi:hypothetical protein